LNCKTTYFCLQHLVGCCLW